MSVNHKKKSVQQQNRKHQDKMAHRKKQVRSGGTPSQSQNDIMRNNYNNSVRHKSFFNPDVLAGFERPEEK